MSSDNNTNEINGISLQQQATIDQLANRKRWIDRNVDNGCLTASSFGCAVGLKGRVYDYVHYLRQQVGTAAEFRGNSATFHGQRTENTSKMVYEVLCCGGRTIDDGGFYPAVTKETGEGHLACSPDGIVSWYENEEARDENLPTAASDEDTPLEIRKMGDDNSHGSNSTNDNAMKNNLWNESHANMLRRAARRPKRLLEIKSPTSGIYNGSRYDQTPHGIPKAYMCQIQGQLYITGADDCDFFVFVSRYPPELALWRVKKSQTFWDWMLPKLIKVCEFVGVKPKETPTEEILPRDFKWDDFPDWGSIPVEGIYVPTNLITGNPLNDVKTFPYFFRLQTQQQQQQQQQNVQIIRGTVPDRNNFILHPIMRSLVAKNVREGDWILWRRNYYNRSSHNKIINHESCRENQATSNQQKKCVCCGATPRRLFYKNDSNGHDDDDDHDEDVDEGEQETFILRVLSVRPDLDKIEAEIHYFEDADDETDQDVDSNISFSNENQNNKDDDVISTPLLCDCLNNSNQKNMVDEQQQHLFTLSPQTKSRQQKREEKIVNEIFTSCPVCNLLVTMNENANSSLLVGGGSGNDNAADTINLSQQSATSNLSSSSPMRRHLLLSQRTNPETPEKTKTIMFTPTKFDDIVVIRRKARPVKDEVRYWKNSVEDERKRKSAHGDDAKIISTCKNEKSLPVLVTIEENNNHFSSNQKRLLPQQHRRLFFTTTSIQLIIQLWNDPIKVLLRTPTCKSLACLDASLRELRKTIGGSMLLVSPNCAAAVWHVVSLLEKEEEDVMKRKTEWLGKRKTSSSFSGDSQVSSSSTGSNNESQEVINREKNNNHCNNRDDDGVGAITGIVFSTASAEADEVPTSNSNAVNGNHGGDPSNNLPSNQSSAATSADNSQNNSNNSQNHQSSFTPGYVFKSKNSKAFKQELKEYLHKRDQPRLWIQDLFQHSTICHRLLLEAIHQSGSVQRHILVGNRICAVMTLKVYNNLLNENQMVGHLRRSASPLLPPPNPVSMVGAKKNAVMTAIGTSNSNNNNRASFSQNDDCYKDFEFGTTTMSNVTIHNKQNSELPPLPVGSSSTNNSQNVDIASRQEQPQLLHDVWKIPLWIVCSDRNFENVSSSNNNNESGNNLLECGELPDIYKLIEACSYRDLETPWVWFVTKN